MLPSCSAANQTDAEDQCYTVQGFAYNGCGTAINRVELTLDGGKTWKYCFKKYLPKPLRFVLILFIDLIICLILDSSNAKTRREALGMDLLVRIGVVVSSYNTLIPCRSCDVSLHEFMHSSEMAVRAMDGRMQMQPEHMAW